MAKFVDCMVEESFEYSDSPSTILDEIKQPMEVNPNEEGMSECNKEDYFSVVEDKSYNSCVDNAFKFSSNGVGTENTSTRERKKKDAVTKLQISHKFLQAKKVLAKAKNRFTSHKNLLQGKRKLGNQWDITGIGNHVTPKINKHEEVSVSTA